MRAEATVPVNCPAGIEVRLAPEPSNKVAVTVPVTSSGLTGAALRIPTRLPLTNKVWFAGLTSKVPVTFNAESVPTSVIPVYDPAIRADGTVPDVRLSAFRLEKS